VKARIFLGYTSNMISSGVRESIRYLVQHKLVGTRGRKEDLLCATMDHPRLFLPSIAGDISTY
jgi:hypothetical protein